MEDTEAAWEQFVSETEDDEAYANLSEDEMRDAFEDWLLERLCNEEEERERFLADRWDNCY